MNDQQLDSLLEKVHAELQRVDHVDDEERKLLEELDRDIRDLLQRRDSETLPMVERMGKAIERFEVKYPAFTRMLSDISAILSNAGI
ncbi:MAG: DUF4404 family protein [Anaerolineaceae bacterium]|jgi:translation elongation factor EF-Tu-like GTPase|nr:MAG: DUF4404 family protein [Anaerolineaceae bacterium]